MANAQPMSVGTEELIVALRAAQGVEAMMDELYAYSSDVYYMSAAEFRRVYERVGRVWPARALALIVHERAREWALEDIQWLAAAGRRPMRAEDWHAHDEGWAPEYVTLDNSPSEFDLVCRDNPKVAAWLLSNEFGLEPEAAEWFGPMIRRLGEY